VAKNRETPLIKERPARYGRRRPFIPLRDLGALAGALLFAALSLVAIYVAARVAEVEDGTVLAALLIVPALLYLLFSGRVSEFKGPGGLEVRLAEVANRTIPVGDDDRSTGALAYEQVRAVERGRKESFLSRVSDITPDEPVVLTLTLGADEIDGSAAADYARGLTQFPRFRFVAILDSHGALVSYMEERSFRHLIEADVMDAQQLLNNIHRQDVGAVRAHPGMVVTSVTPDTSIAGALREMERLRLNAMLVTDNGRVKGIVERERLANALLLSLVDHGAA
jgi:CBS domain-containing protein